MRQASLLLDLGQRLQRLIGEYRSATESLTAADLAWRPPGGGWSIGELLEHLVSSADSYLLPMRQLVERRAPRGEPGEWRPSLGGRLLVRGLAGKRRLPAPRRYQPGEPREGVAAAFVLRLERTARLMDEAREHRWRSIRLASPITPLLRLNLGDAFMGLVVHAERHLAQLHRLLDARQPEG